MVWHAVVRKTDGVLVSTGTVVASTLPTTLEALPLPRDINWAVERWDPATRTIVAKPAPPADVDRVADFMAANTWLDPRLTAAQRTQFRTALGTLLGTRKFRGPNEPVNL